MPSCVPMTRRRSAAASPPRGQAAKPSEQRTSSRPGLSNGRCGSPRWREHTGSCFVPVGSRRDRPGRHGGGGHLPLSPRRDIRQTATLWNPLNQYTQKGATAHRPAATHDRQKSGSGIPSAQSIGEWLRTWNTTLEYATGV